MELQEQFRPSSDIMETMTKYVDLELDQSQLNSSSKIQQSMWTSEARTLKVEFSEFLSIFTPYHAKTPWKTGFQRYVWRFFPRYGNYCGPSWSSGRETGSTVWDTPPIDNLDLCCFHHDVGFDSHEQADLHRADVNFLKCLEEIPRNGGRAGNHSISEFYRKLFILGFKRVMVPYRMLLLDMSVASEGKL
jgi:hypothetical protein